ncbi:MAG: hypothetical protein KGJ23_07975 [Euryarchaeota archaeon]|nr:hypothetical protein [Euryarchaeota archaeon]MDE1836538.1 hypothetical protein [Euryarchaeota archaeon]MDE1879267.1 hypothetical protein [Euryarchaeota archaeon]MDE2044508.1 hypothetical protein [Thermoplasmata archaeon]
MKGEDAAVKRGIENLVGALMDPVIVMPGGWGETLPEWLKGAVKMERLAQNAADLGRSAPSKEAGDAEVVAYLYTASLTRPMGDRLTKVYLNLAPKVMERFIGGHQPALDDVRVNGLSVDEERELKKLRGWLYRQRTEGGKARRAGKS